MNFHVLLSLKLGRDGYSGLELDIPPFPRRRLEQASIGISLPPGGLISDKTLVS